MPKVPYVPPSCSRSAFTCPRKRLNLGKLRDFTLLAALVALFFASPSPALAQQDPLLKFIRVTNLKDLDNSLADGSYRGEEGILRIKPEVGKAFGMKVLMDQDYLDSRDLFRKAESAFEKARMTTASKETESFPGEHIRTISENILLYKAMVESAKKKLLAYRSRLNASVDERLNDAICTEVMERLFTQSLKRTDYQLRDALGYFYNLCRGASQNAFPLTPENVVFVNEVFHQFATGSPVGGVLFFGLDRQDDYRGKGVYNSWQNAVGSREFPHLQALEETLNKFNTQSDKIDPLLFIALMKRESSFDHRAVSSMGAAGLTQILPETALTLGMKNTYNPSYLAEAASLSRLERKTKNQATATLFQINEENGLAVAAQARDLMQKALDFGQKKERLFSQYRKDLLQMGADDRLNPSLSIEYGFRYFLQMMKQQKGDVSLALASYSAGARHVREYKGIPPFSETVHFRNRVIELYRIYLQRLRVSDKTF